MSSVHDQLKSKDDLEALRIMSRAVAEDFDNAETPMERSMLSRTLALLIKEIRQGEIALIKAAALQPPDEGPDELELMRLKKANG